ncbi:MAG TPA: DUF2784 domain-containing protein [Rubrivivax sp.]|jgi:membrane protein implicated in regulation of membrane protease activity|nr:DUF2784 domain-containing protein [Rubrivivax sp.]
MGMGWSILADMVLVVHGVFIAWVALGAFAVLRWPRLLWWHLPALAWGLWIEASAGLCPLTPLEMWLRHRAGQVGYEGSFIDHHLGALIYPQGLTPAAQWRIALILGAYNLVLYLLIVRRRLRRRRMP